MCPYIYIVLGKNDAMLLAVIPKHLIRWFIGHQRRPRSESACWAFIYSIRVCAQSASAQLKCEKIWNVINNIYPRIYMIRQPRGHCKGFAPPLAYPDYLLDARCWSPVLYEGGWWDAAQGFYFLPVEVMGLNWWAARRAYRRTRIGNIGFLKSVAMFRDL